MDAIVLALAEQGHWFLATVVLAVCWFLERRFSAKLRAHDESNKADFGNVDSRLDKLRDDMHAGFKDLGERMARIEGTLNERHRKED